MRESGTADEAELIAWEKKHNHGHTAYCYANYPKGKSHDSFCSCDCHQLGLPTMAFIEPAFTDYRGAITNILSGREVRHVALITQAKGTVRGNHYHPDEGGCQWLYLLEGGLTAVTCPLMDTEEEVVGGRVRQPIQPGSLLYIPPWTAHAFLATEPSTFLAIDEYSHAPERYAVVTRPWELIPHELRV